VDVELAVGVVEGNSVGAALGATVAVGLGLTVGVAVANAVPVGDAVGAKGAISASSIETEAAGASFATIGKKTSYNGSCTPSIACMRLPTAS
jgi:hypothetical protein